VELSGAGHWPQEEAPDEVARALLSFLDTQREGVSARALVRS
jgi:pimeloyl-ACP methyl ester carboxylesterase